MIKISPEFWVPGVAVLGFSFIVGLAIFKVNKVLDAVVAHEMSRSFNYAIACEGQLYSFIGVKSATRYDGAYMIEKDGVKAYFPIAQCKLTETEVSK